MSSGYQSTPHRSGISTKAHEEREPNTKGNVWDFIMKPNAPGWLRRLSWNHTDNEVRILPYPDVDNPGSFEPTRLTMMDDEFPVFGNWIRRYWGITYFGNPGLSMIIGNDDDPNEVEEMKRQSPIFKIMRAVGQGSHWSSGVDSSGWDSLTKGAKKILKMPERMCFVQCFVFRHNNELFFEPGRKPPLGARPNSPVAVLMLGKSAWKGLVAAIDSGTEPYQEDPISLNPGAFFHFRQKTMATDDADTYSAVDDKKMQAQGYEVNIIPSIKGPAGQTISPSFAGKEALVMQKVKPWDQLIQVTPPDLQAKRICEGFMACPDERLKEIFVRILKYSFRDQKEWLTDKVLDYGKVVSGPTSALAPRTEHRPAPRPVEKPLSNPVPSVPATEDLFTYEEGQEEDNTPVKVEEVTPQERARQALAKAQAESAARDKARASVLEKLNTTETATK